MGIRRIIGAGVAILMIATAPMGASAQAVVGGGIQTPILTIDSERLYSESNFGRQTAREFEGKGAELALENRQIETDLGDEEQQLTDRRPVIAPAEFRVLADAFDSKVQEARKSQDGKSRALTQELEERRVFFYNTAIPVLEQLMRSTGAAVILERRSVFISVNTIDITQEAIDQLNAAFAQEPAQMPAKN